MNHTESLNYLLNVWNEAIKIFDKTLLIASLREHYKDICSNGDIIVHTLLTCLENEQNINANELYIKSELSRNAKYNYTESCISSLIVVLKEWNKQKEMKPDPWWAL